MKKKSLKLKFELKEQKNINEMFEQLKGEGYKSICIVTDIEPITVTKYKVGKIFEIWAWYLENNYETPKI